MPSENKVAIVVVAYNNATLILKQMQCIEKFCLDDDFDIIVTDNSTNEDAADAVKYHVKERGHKYFRTMASSSNGSDSHAFACNITYFHKKDKYDYFLFLDHDNFPVKQFSVVDVLNGNVITGLPQHKDKSYYWPGCVMFNNRVIPHDLINFSVSHKLGLDTGGMLYRVVDDFAGRVGEFDEVYCENPSFADSQYSFYAMINNGMFMHFINSSNWNPIERNDERINSLFNILSEKTGI